MSLLTGGTHSLGENKFSYKQFLMMSEGDWGVITRSKTG